MKVATHTHSVRPALKNSIVVAILFPKITKMFANELISIQIEAQIVEKKTGEFTTIWWWKKSGHFEKVVNLHKKSKTLLSSKRPKKNGDRYLAYNDRQQMNNFTDKI